MDGILVGTIPRDHVSQVLSIELAQKQFIGVKTISMQRNVIPTLNEGNWNIQKSDHLEN